MGDLIARGMSAKNTVDIATNTAALDYGLK
jgi:hypothetical protein